MPTLSILTATERSVLLLLVEGKPCKQMSSAMFVSDYTIKKHLKNIYEKIGVNSRSEAVIWLLQQLYPTIINIENIKNDIDKALLKKVA